MQTGCGWVSVESAMAAAAAASGLPAQTPIGATRISEPLDWLARSAAARAASALPAGARAAAPSARAVVCAAVERGGGEPAPIGLGHRLGVVGRAPGQRPRQGQRQFRVVGRLARRGCSRFRRRAGRARRPDSARAIAAAGWNSTSDPSESPITCPSRQPIARSSATPSGARGQASVTRGSRRGSVLPRQVRARSVATAAGGAAEAGRGPAFPLRRVGDRLAVLGHQHAAGGQQQRVTGDHVERVDRPQRQRGDAVAHRDARQPVGDRRQRHEPAGRHGAAVPHRPLPGAVVQEHHVARRELSRPRRSIATGWPLRVIVAALGPGDQVRPAIRAQRREHHAEHRLAPAQQRDRDGAAAAAFQEGAGAVMRIDHPAEAVGRCFQHAGFLADEAGGQQARSGGRAGTARSRGPPGAVTWSEKRGPAGRQNSAATIRPAVSTASMTSGRMACGEGGTEVPFGTAGPRIGGMHCAVPPADRLRQSCGENQTEIGLIPARVEANSPVS